MARRGFGWMVNVTTAVVATVATLAVVEGYLRWSGSLEVDATPGCYAFSDNPRLMYEPKPLCEGTNALGMRDHAVVPTAARPIVALGDSITFGPGVAIDETWPKQLQRFLGGTGRRTQVLNFGVQGYSTVQEVETLRVKALPFRPRTVLLQYCFNDEEIYTTIFDGMVDDMRRRHGETFVDALDPRHGTLVRRLLLTRTAIAVRLALARLRSARAGGPDNAITTYYREHSPVREGFTALQGLARQHDLDVLVLIFPHAYGAHADRVGGHPLPEITEFPNAWVFDNAKVLSLCRELGLACVDMAQRFHEHPMLRRIPGHRLFTDGCCHLTALGHKAMAWVVFRELAARGLLGHHVPAEHPDPLTAAHVGPDGAPPEGRAWRDDSRGRRP